VNSKTHVSIAMIQNNMHLCIEPITSECLQVLATTQLPLASASAAQGSAARHASPSGRATGMPWQSCDFQFLCANLLAVFTIVRLYISACRCQK
jgi:hypothetical protein